MRESVPTKEGLRLRKDKTRSNKLTVRESVPTKEGLRPWHLNFNGYYFLVRESVPTKEGLRLPSTSGKIFTFSGVRESVPTKEGLRRCVVENIELDSHL